MLGNIHHKWQRTSRKHVATTRIPQLLDQLITSSQICAWYTKVGLEASNDKHMLRDLMEIFEEMAEVEPARLSSDETQHHEEWLYPHGEQFGAPRLWQKLRQDDLSITCC